MRNHKALLEVASDERAEALAAVGSATLGVIGMGVEAAGFAVKALRPDWVVSSKVNAPTVGGRIATGGAFIAALAGVADAVQYAMAATRTVSKGDAVSARHYLTAATFSALSATAFGVAALVSSMLLLTTGLGIAFMLIAYTSYRDAKKNESTPIEEWIRKSRWGLPDESRRWLTSDQLVAATNSLNVALIGASAHVSIQIRPMIAPTSSDDALSLAFRDPNSIPMNAYLVFEINLPHYEPELSAYEFIILGKNPLSKALNILACGKSEKSLESPGPDFHIDKVIEKEGSISKDYNPKLKRLRIEGTVRSMESTLPTALTLYVTYWVRKNDARPLKIVYSD
ncbi:hypothetical protein SAMN05660463_03511 [Pseudomonas sp. URIL14HWK12:I9]|nr:hypothetical protein F474_04226 [Pseudomonas sp. URIL14HWK12:I12]PVZ22061.1 hypothetical protein F470_04226 [Pseudomonas sp. URIL14HWK12:I10]PVZ30856.1 hypothetical protein F472_03872 [Pseudomonas sp. URIL14HWK12:I11]SNZ17168.1 hypothetical protein SAMN05660463_03511 [Pseudomonas sp. URIL14HWK12:I9]